MPTPTTCPNHPDTTLRHMPVLGTPDQISCPLCFLTIQAPTTYDGAREPGAVAIGYRADGTPESVTVTLPDGYDADHGAMFAALVDLAAAYGRATGMDPALALGDVTECLDSYA